MVGDMDADALAEPPTLRHPPGAARRTRWTSRSTRPPIPRPDAPLEDILLDLIGSPNIASRRWVWQQYDHQVQLNTVIVPGRRRRAAAHQEDRRRHRGVHRRQRPPDLPRPLSGRQGGGGRGGPQRLLRGRQAHRHHQLPQLRQSRQRAHRLPAGPGHRGHGRGLRGPRHAGHLGQRLALQRELRAAHLPDGGRGDARPHGRRRPPTAPSAFKDEGDVVYLLGDAAPALDGSEYQKRWFGGPKGRPAGRIPDVDLAAEVALQALVREAIAARLLRSRPRLLRRRPGRGAGRVLPGRAASGPRHLDGVPGLGARLGPPWPGAARRARGSWPLAEPCDLALVRRGAHAGGRARWQPTTPRAAGGARARRRRHRCPRWARRRRRTGRDVEALGQRLACAAGRRLCEDVYESALPRSHGGMMRDSVAGRLTPR